ncbi:hypothetical protein UFOVP346_18 [uncultured Caudovirales phage]|uniref:Uncharacterized protein n=1 Tax=uncultured Caudovirales phage TaxID=2100421 RepID=A0A6J5LY81_9CAUD|nr:hypothetical protein UFOVP346_18 [uncultured Caudovirales phage]
MATTGKTKVVILDAILHYAKVFEENRDMGNDKVDHSDTDGIYSVDLELTLEQVDQLKALGVPAVALGYQTFKKREEGDTYTYKVKRQHLSKNLKDDSGNRQMMGAPLVFDYNAALKAWDDNSRAGRFDEFIVPWKMSDGLIGNGTRAKVKLSVYKGRATIVTLERIGFTELVQYTGTDSESVYF